MADQSEFDGERGVVLVSALKKSHHFMPTSDDFDLEGGDGGDDGLGSQGVRFAEKDFFLNSSDRSLLQTKMMQLSSDEGGLPRSQPKKKVRWNLASGL